MGPSVVQDIQKERLNSVSNPAELALVQQPVRGDRYPVWDVIEHCKERRKAGKYWPEYHPHPKTC
jgi:hypothetical protein